jgi:hypothetical protein
MFCRAILRPKDRQETHEWDGPHLGDKRMFEELDLRITGKSPSSVATTLATCNGCTDYTCHTDCGTCNSDACTLNCTQSGGAPGCTFTCPPTTN